VNVLLALDPQRAARGRDVFSRQPYEVRFDFQGVTAGVATNSRFLVDHLRLGYGSFEASKANSLEVAILGLEAGTDGFERSFATLLPGRSAREHVVVPMQGELIYLLGDRASLAYYTTMNLFGGVVARLRERYTCLHAASVSRRQRGVILCGAARCGKTSLTATMILQGFDYSSDDVTLIERESLEVAAFPRALNIREESPELSPALIAGARRIGRFAIADQERLIVDLGRPMPASVEPVAVCFPDYSTDALAEVRPVTKAEALLQLMRHRFHPLGTHADSALAADFDALGRLAEHCACYALTFSDPVAASQLIARELLETDCHA
jgi:hypothetical protein